VPVAMLAAAAGGLVLIVIGALVRRRAGPVYDVSRWGNPWWLYGWLMIVLGWLLEVLAVMALIGLAAGVK
jgi:hypothetical protein